METNEKWVYEKGKLTLHTQLRDGKCVYTGETEEYYKSLGFVIDTYENILPLLEEAEYAQILRDAGYNVIISENKEGD